MAQALQASAESEQRFRNSEANASAIVQGIPDLLFRSSADGVYLGFAANDETLLYVKPEQFLGKRVTDVLPPDIGQAVMATMARTLATKTVQQMEYALDLPSGRGDFEARLVALAGGDVLAVVRDITVAKQAHRQLQASLREK